MISRVYFGVDDGREGGRGVEEGKGAMKQRRVKAERASRKQMYWAIK